MNKFVSRLAALAAAALMLAGALVPLPVFAAEGSPTASLHFVLSDGSIRTRIQSTEQLQNVTIKISNFPFSEQPVHVSDIEITGNFNFLASRSTIAEDRTNSTLTIEVPVTKYTGSDPLETKIKLTVKNTELGTFEFPVHFLDNNDEDPIFEIKHVMYNNFDGTDADRVDKDDVVTLLVTVHDKNFTKQEYDSLTAAQKAEFSAVLTNNIFSYTRSYNFKNFKSINEDEGVQYCVVFEDVRYRGIDNAFGIRVTYPNVLGIGENESSLYTDVEGVLREDEGSSSSRYDDDDDDSGSGGSSSTKVPPPTPTIIISEYDYGGGNVSAAGSFTLRMRFTNTSDRLPIDNIVAKITVPEAFTLTSSSNTFYIDRLSRESSVNREIQLSVKPDAEPVSQVVKVDFTFETVINRERRSLNASQEIGIPVSQLDRFSMNPVEVPAEIYVGDSNSFEVTFINRGKTPVYNVTAEVTGNLAQPGQRQFIGNVASGTEDSVDFLLSANEGGPITGEVIITYDDANMNVKELREPFSTNAIAMEVPEFDPNMVPDDIPMEEPPKWYEQVPVWGWVAGGVAVLVVLSFISKLIRAHKEKKLLEDDDEDF